LGLRAEVRLLLGRLRHLVDDLPGALQEISRLRGQAGLRGEADVELAVDLDRIGRQYLHLRLQCFDLLLQDRDPRVACT